MTAPKPPLPRQTILGKLTNIVRNAQGKIDFSRLNLKANAKVPELLVQEVNAQQAQVFPLLGDRYLLGRSSQCDIQIKNQLVSQTHASIQRDRHQGFRFIIRDEKSTNGLYRGKRRLSKTTLYHGDILTLGPPELESAVTIQYLNPPPWYIRVLRYKLYGITGIFVLGALIMGLEWQKFSADLKRVPAPGPVIVYARDGQTTLSSPRTTTHRDLQRLSDFSPYLPKAVVASEDSRFYWHLGVDPLGVARATFFTLRGVQREGASTVTQQVARSLFRDYVGADDSIQRKIREIVVALKLEMFNSKNDILLTYLNRVYLGTGNYGFEDAAQFYFAKPAKQLTLSEAATLVGMLPAPNNFNPVKDLKTAEGLRNRVINRMADMGLVTAEEARQALLSVIQVTPEARKELRGEATKAPYFYAYVFEELQAKSPFLAQQGNLIIETSLDLGMQTQAEQSLKAYVETIGASSNFSQGAIVTLEASTGKILALTGGVDFQQSQFNRATQALRQPGSTFKVFAYTAALEQGIPTSQTYACNALDWEGQTFAGCRSGGSQLDLPQSLALSENVVALRIAREVSLAKVINTAKRMGIQSELKSVPALVLGQSEVTVLELTGAFSVLANRGVENPPHAIQRILDGASCVDRRNLQTCRVIYDIAQVQYGQTQVLSAQVADTMTNLLIGVVQGGTGRSAAIPGVEVAGKTGTTNDNIDLWFVGYAPAQQVVTGVWLGNDDNKPTGGSSAQAAQLWGDYMGKVLQ